MQDTSHSQLRPVQPHMGIASIPTMPDPAPAGWALSLQSVLSQGTEMEATMSGCCYGMVRQLSTPDFLLLQGLPHIGSCLSQLRCREKPDFPLSSGSTWAEGLSLWSLFLGQRVTQTQVPVPKATKPNCCFSVLALWLLALGFVGAGAFPAVRLPLLVQAADADPLPPAHRDVLLHKAGQHACRKSTHTALECWDYPRQRATLPL